MSGLLFTLTGNQDNVSEWSDMYEWTVVYCCLRLAGNQDNVSEWSTCMSGLLFTVGRESG